MSTDGRESNRFDTTPTNQELTDLMNHIDSMIRINSINWYPVQKYGVAPKRMCMCNWSTLDLQPEMARNDLDEVGISVGFGVCFGDGHNLVGRE